MHIFSKRSDYWCSFFKLFILHTTIPFYCNYYPNKKNNHRQFKRSPQVIQNLFFILPIGKCSTNMRFNLKIEHQ